jgi:ATP-binding cassette subfamily F protein 3
MSSNPNLIQMSGGYKSFGPQKIFEDATFAINEGEHVGVIGPNGAGKSTLFKIMIDEDSLDNGDIIRSKRLRIGYLSQHDLWTDTETGNDYLERTCTLPVWHAKSIGSDLQVSEEIFEKPIMSLSGGYRMRIKLIGLLGKDPNLMMLDEPTNYLDLETTILLEKFLQNYEGAFLLISHDREVLRRTTDHILEVEGGEIIKFSGNIDDYFEQKELLRSQLEATAAGQAKKREAVMDFVSKFGAKASKAKQAQSRMKSLEKMEVIEFKPVPVRASIRIPQPAHVGKVVMKLKDCAFGYGDRTVIEDVNMEIERGDHVAVIGLNGAGKSTLLKGIAGTLAPQKGTRELGYQVELAIFNQHVIEQLNPDHTVLESLEEVAKYNATQQEIRQMAGSLLFKTEQVTKKVKVLSGGEKSRLSLGRILLQKVSCILLDEPTNHLDFETVETLTQALDTYKGTLIVVSHDRGFIRRVSKKILEVSKGEVLVYPGTYDEYVWSLQQRLANEDVNEESEPARKSKKSADKSKKGPSNNSLKDLQKKMDDTQAEITKLEAEISTMNQKLMDGHGNVTEMTAHMARNAKAIEELEARWLLDSAEKEKLEQAKH